MNPDYAPFAVFMWQGNPNLHPLTCRIDSGHGMMSWDILGDRELFCPVCGWQQKEVPDVVLSMFMDVARDAIEEVSEVSNG